MQRHAGCRSRSRPFLASVVGLSIRTTPDPTSGQSIPSITRPLDSPFPRSPDPWAVHFLYHKTSGQSIPSITRPQGSLFPRSQDPWTVYLFFYHKTPGQSTSSITKSLDSPFPRSQDLACPPSLSQDPWTVHLLYHKTPGQSIPSITKTLDSPSPRSWTRPLGLRSWTGPMDHMRRQPSRLSPLEHFRFEYITPLLPTHTHTHLSLIHISEPTRPP